MSFQKVNLEDTARTEDKIGVLVYGYDENELKVLKTYCDEQSIEHFILVNDSMIEMSLESLLHVNKVEDSSSTLMNAKVIIMNGFSGSDLQTFLKNFKTTGLERPIFATVTPNSKKWPFKALVNELIKEHEMMKNRNKK